MNLMINNYCNLHCPYCFAQQAMNSQDSKEISLENLKKAMDWIATVEGSREIRLIGGEPTLHSKLGEIFDTIIEDGRFDRIFIFSNMTFGPEVLDLILSRKDKIDFGFLPNINELDLVFKVQKERIYMNMDILSRELGNFDSIGLNLYDPNMDLSLWEDFITRFDLRQMRFSIALPSEKPGEDFDFYNFFHAYQNSLLTLAEWAKKYRMNIHNDCNSLPICCFDDSAVVKILKICPSIFGSMYCYKPAYDIRTDLKMMPCFVCHVEEEKLRSIDEFCTMEELDDYLAEIRKPFAKGVARKECYNCERYAATGQSCACMIYRREI